jgi:oxaloacetate decarboxylase beta subunit
LLKLWDDREKLIERFKKKAPTNFLLMHGMACNSSGVIGSAICAGILWSFFV